RSAVLADAVVEAQLTVVIALVAKAILPVRARRLEAGPVVILVAEPRPGPEVPSIAEPLSCLRRGAHHRERGREGQQLHPLRSHCISSLLIPEEPSLARRKADSGRRIP